MSLEKIKTLLSSGLNPGTIMKGIAAIDPRLRGFITASSAAGYGADSIINYLNEMTTSAPQRQRQGDVLSRTARGTARPEEVAEARGIDDASKAEGMVRSIASLGGGIAGLAGGMSAQTPESPEVLGPEPAQRQQQPGGFRDDYPFDRRQIEGGAQRQIGHQQQQIDMDEPQQQDPRDPSRLGAPPATLLLEQQERQSGTGGYVKKALDGVEYFDLPDQTREPIAPLVKALFNLEQKKIPWKDKSVQRLVKGIRSRVGLAEREAARAGMELPQQQSPQAQQQMGPSIDDKVDEFLSRAYKLLGE